MAMGSSIGESSAFAIAAFVARLASLERYGPGEYTMATYAAGAFILETTTPADLQVETTGPIAPLLLSREASSAAPISLTRTGPPAALALSRIHEEMNNA
jgi:hypothetical protein